MSRQCALHPLGEFGACSGPLGEPVFGIVLGFRGITPVVEPAEFLPAVIVGLAREIIQGIAQEMDIRVL